MKSSPRLALTLLEALAAILLLGLITVCLGQWLQQTGRMGVRLTELGQNQRTSDAARRQIVRDVAHRIGNWEVSTDGQTLQFTAIVREAAHPAAVFDVTWRLAEGHVERRETASTANAIPQVQMVASAASGTRFQVQDGALWLLWENTPDRIFPFLLAAEW